jgi:hypothetical protein
MRSLPIRRGYPVPWFVAEVDGDYHFPTADARKITAALTKHLCWVCGQPLGAFKSFVIGPMCAVNRTTSEPPNHHECAVFSARACPFLARPHMKRQKEHPEGATDAPGIMLQRNPGVALVWTTRDFWIRRAPKGTAEGFLFRLGSPSGVLWYAEGRAATREEVMQSISSGLPLLREIAEQDGEEAIKLLDRSYTDALRLVPA